jgi:hypothetical protein
MTKRKAAKILIKSKKGIMCGDFPCYECPIHPCTTKCKNNNDRKRLARVWLRNHPSLWDRIKIATRGKK